MRSISAGLALVIISGSICAQPVTWPVAQGGNGHQYEAISVPGGVTWAAANQAAQNSGGHLVTITSAAENAFVFGLINSPQFWLIQYGWSSGPWIGAFQPAGSPEPSGNWQWVTGEPWGYTNWAPAQPDNACCGTPCVPQDHISFGDYNVTAQWDDETTPPCPGWSSPVAYVVEWPIPATPEYQTNSFQASLDINGALGTQQTAALVNVPIGATANLNLSSFNIGQVWDLATGAAPLIPSSAGAITLSDGQIVNVDLSDPTLSFWFNFLSGPTWGPTTTLSIPFSFPFATSVSGQMVVAAPAMASGYALSQPLRLVIQ